MNNPWISHVKKYAIENNISYKDAMKSAKSSYVKVDSFDSHSQIGGGIDSFDIENMPPLSQKDNILADTDTNILLNVIGNNLPQDTGIIELPEMVNIQKNNPITDESVKLLIKYAQMYSAFNAIKCLEISSAIIGPCTSYLRKNDPINWTNNAKNVLGNEMNWKNKKNENNIKLNLESLGLEYYGCMSTNNGSGDMTISLSYDRQRRIIFVVYGTSSPLARHLGLSSVGGLLKSAVMESGKPLLFLDEEVDDCIQYTTKDLCTKLGAIDNCGVSFTGKCAKKIRTYQKSNNTIKSDYCRLPKNVMDIYNISRNRLLVAIIELEMEVNAPVQVVFGGHGFGSMFATLAALDYAILIDRNRTLGDTFVINNGNIIWARNDPLEFQIETIKLDDGSKNYNIYRHRNNIPLKIVSNNIHLYASAPYGFANEPFTKLVEMYVPYKYNIINKLDSVISIGGTYQSGITIRFSKIGVATIKEMLESLQKLSEKYDKNSPISKAITWMNKNGVTNSLTDIYNSSSASVTSEVMTRISKRIPFIGFPLSVINDMWVINKAFKAHSQATYLAGMATSEYNFEMHVI